MHAASPGEFACMCMSWFPSMPSTPRALSERLLKLTHSPVDQHSPSLTCASERGIPDSFIEGAAGIHNNVNLVALSQSRQCREQDAHVGHDASNQELLAPSGLQGGKLRAQGGDGSTCTSRGCLALQGQTAVQQ